MTADPMHGVRTAFLWDDANYRDHNGWSLANKYKVNHYRRQHGQMGHNAVCRYPANDGDYPYRKSEPTNFYRVPFNSPTWGQRCAVNLPEVHRIQRIAHLDYSVGQPTILWMMCDDSKYLRKLPIARFREHCLLTAEFFGEWTIGVVLGLELNEYWTPTVARPRMAAVREAFPGLHVALHFTRTMTREKLVSGWLPTLKPESVAIQYGWETPVGPATRYWVNAIKPYRVGGGEYSKNPSPIEGRAIMANGGIYVLNG